MRKINGSTDLDVNDDGQLHNVLAGSALSTILRTIPVEFRAVVRGNVGAETGDTWDVTPEFGQVEALLKLGTTDLARQFLAVVPPWPMAAGYTGAKPDPIGKATVATPGGLVHRIGLTDDDIIFQGELVIQEIGSLSLSFPGLGGSTALPGVWVFWEALYR